MKKRTCVLLIRNASMHCSFSKIPSKSIGILQKTVPLLIIVQIFRGVFHIITICSSLFRNTSNSLFMPIFYLNLCFSWWWTIKLNKCMRNLIADGMLTSRCQQELRVLWILLWLKSFGAPNVLSHNGRLEKLFKKLLTLNLLWQTQK